MAGPPESAEAEAPAGGSGYTTSKAPRRPYNLSKQRERWTDAEHAAFLEALQKYGRAWKMIEEHIGTKTTVQIRSHAQKFFSKVDRERAAGASAGTWPITIPPPRPKRKNNQAAASKPASQPGSGSFILHHVLRDRAQQLLGGATDPNLVDTVAASAATAATSAAAAVMSAAQQFKSRQSAQQEAGWSGMPGVEAAASPTSTGFTASHAPSIYIPSAYAPGPNAFAAEALKPMQTETPLPQHDCVSEDWGSMSGTIVNRAAAAASQWGVAHVRDQLPPWDQNSGSHAAAMAGLHELHRQPKQQGPVMPSSLVSHQSAASLGERAQSSSSPPESPESDNDTMADPRSSHEGEEEHAAQGVDRAYSGAAAPRLEVLGIRPGLAEHFSRSGGLRRPSSSQQLPLPAALDRAGRLDGMPLGSAADEACPRQSTSSTLSEGMQIDIAPAMQQHAGALHMPFCDRKPAFSPGPALGEEVAPPRALTWQASDPYPLRRVKRRHVSDFQQQRSLQALLKARPTTTASRQHFPGLEMVPDGDPCMLPMQSAPPMARPVGRRSVPIQPIAMHGSLTAPLPQSESLGLAAEVTDLTPRQGPVQLRPVSIPSQMDRPQGFQPYAAVQAAQAASSAWATPELPQSDASQQ